MNGKKNPKYVQAQKEGKVDYSTIPFSVLADDARAHSEGANKYGRFNWTRDDIEARTYIAAICRHLFGDPATNTLGWVNGEDIDPDSGLNHLTKIRACCALVMDAQAKGKLIDNRLEAESKSEEPAESENDTAQYDYSELEKRVVGQLMSGGSMKTATEIFYGAGHRPTRGEAQANVAKSLYERYSEKGEEPKFYFTGDDGKDREVEKQYAVLVQMKNGLQHKLHGPYTAAEAADKAKEARRHDSLSVTTYELTTTTE